jgi:hypothetical protein
MPVRRAYTGFAFSSVLHKFVIYRRLQIPPPLRSRSALNRWQVKHDMVQYIEFTFAVSSVSWMLAYTMRLRGPRGEGGGGVVSKWERRGGPSFVIHPPDAGWKWQSATFLGKRNKLVTVLQSRTQRLRRKFFLARSVPIEILNPYIR